ncbi:DNA-binding protein [Pseudomonas veronii]|uniref:DNA-binding protein n=1 Tax=Pseudomonas veronii TaxID=76761 RepID=UPI0018E76C67|nr:DNA-binding protein [Pseudomonas veronii]MBJ2180129.1 DNA-binding protein [Pseudomonas veronii]
MIDSKTKHITLDQVKCTAAELERKGCKVTARSVREHLGAGSSATISKFLNQLPSYKDSNLSPSDYLAKFPDRFKAIIMGIYTELIDAAEAEKRKKIMEIQELEKNLRVRWSVHIREKLRAIRNLEAEIQRSANMRIELNNVTARTWKDQEKITDLTARLVKAESENEYLLETIENLKKRCANLQKNIEHFDAQALLQRDSDSQMYSQRISKLEQDLMNSQSQVLELSKELVNSGRHEGSA